MMALPVCSPGWAEQTSADPVAGLQLALPLDCDATDGCLIQNYFDHDSSGGFADYRCGELGYDGHDGIDLRLKNLAVMYAGVAVRAAAAGKVRAVRDEMPDISIREPGRFQEIVGREAGNSVAIRHGGGWETQYSHLKRGSLRVKPGDLVEAGQVLGLVGLSGKTEFPHLHFSVRYRGDPVDPFVGHGRAPGCGADTSSLWTAEARRQLSYRATGIIQAGFSQRKPEIETVEAGGDSQEIIDAGAEAIVFWVELYGIQRGDEQVLTIFDPQDRILVERRQDLLKGKARWFSYVGKKRKGADWPTGRYRAEFALYRPGEGRRQVLGLSRDLVVK